MTQTPVRPKRTEADIRRAVVAAALAYVHETRRATVNPSPDKTRWHQAHVGLLSVVAELEAFLAQAEAAAATVER